ERPRLNPGNLADAHGRLPVRYHDDALASESSNRRDCEELRCDLPPNLAPRTSGTSTQRHSGWRNHRRWREYLCCPFFADLLVLESRVALSRTPLQNPVQLECEINVVEHRRSRQ